jgi:hypothetical protein
VSDSAEEDSEEIKDKVPKKSGFSKQATSKAKKKDVDSPTRRSVANSSNPTTPSPATTTKRHSSPAGLKNRPKALNTGEKPFAIETQPTPTNKVIPKVKQSLKQKMADKLKDIEAKSPGLGSGKKQVFSK